MTETKVITCARCGELVESAYAEDVKELMKLNRRVIEHVICLVCWEKEHGGEHPLFKCSECSGFLSPVDQKHFANLALAGRQICGVAHCNRCREKFDIKMHRQLLVLVNLQRFHIIP